MRRNRLWQLWIALMVILLAACGPAGGETAVSSTDSPDSSGSEEVTTSEESSSSTGSTTTASGLEYIEVEAGTGVQPQPGDIVSVHYIGTLEDGTEFDSSYERGSPIEFTLGRGEVIPGWDEGLALMNVGGKATLIIPPNLAYGEAGAGAVIPPNSTLTFEIELVGISDPLPTPTPLPPPTSIDESEFTVTESGLKYAVIQEGDGEMPQDGGLITVHFAGWLEDGTSIGNTKLNGQPVPFTIGRGDIMEGWDEAIFLMQVGEIAQFYIPPELAFGDEGSGGVIPPGATLIFEFELIDVQEPPPPPAVVDEADFTITETGLQIAVLEAGDGGIPEVGQTVSVNYRGWLEDGTQFDASYDRGTPFEFILGTGSVIPGWDEGVALMQVGETVQLIIPGDLAYGELGSGSIPPNATLIFEVELLEIKEN